MGSEGDTIAAETAWWVYVLVSDSAGRTYVGVTTDPQRRVAEHNGERSGGARTTRVGRPWTLGVLHGPFGGRGEAQVLEHRLRRVRGPARLAKTPPLD